jgi:hypothetical protein
MSETPNRMHNAGITITGLVPAAACLVLTIPLLGGCAQITSDPPGATISVYVEKYQEWVAMGAFHTPCYYPGVEGSSVRVVWNDGVISDTTHVYSSGSPMHFTRPRPPEPPPPPPPPPKPEYRQGRPEVYDLERIKRVAVLPFGNGELTDRMIEAIVHHSRWTVVDRADLKKIIDEQDLQTTSLFDQKTAVKLGKLVGANMVIFGESYENRIVVKAVDVETGKYLVYKNVDNVSGPVAVRSHIALQFLLPYCIKLQGGSIVRIWIGGDADTASPADLEKAAKEAGL